MCGHVTQWLFACVCVCVSEYLCVCVCVSVCLCLCLRQFPSVKLQEMDELLVELDQDSWALQHVARYMPGDAVLPCCHATCRAAVLPISWLLFPPRCPRRMLLPCRCLVSPTHTVRSRCALTLCAHSHTVRRQKGVELFRVQDRQQAERRRER